jgi:hypothetical protein
MWQCASVFLKTEQCRPFLNLDDEDTPAFQPASKNSQFLVNFRREPLGAVVITRYGTTPKATVSAHGRSFRC